MFSDRRPHIVFFISLLLIIGFVPAPLFAFEGVQQPDGEKLSAVRRMYRGYKREFPNVGDISATEARALFDQGKVLFIDAREPEEREVSTLPGAVTGEAFLKNPDLAKGKTAVAYCTVGYRSGVFAGEADRQGLGVLNLRGGIVAWVLDGGKVYHDGRETNRVHVYGKEWNYLPEGYEAVIYGFFEKLVK